MLEVGGGLGVLSEHLAAAGGHVHVVELDRAARGAAARRARSAPGRDAALRRRGRIDLAALDPAPTKVVANLPYGVAATVILRTIEELPRRHALGRDGAARGRRAVRGAARARRVRRAVGARPARVRRPRAAAGLALRLPSRARTSTPCSSGSSGAAPAPPPALRALVQRGSRTGARRCRGRSRWRPAPPPASASACAPRSRRSGRPADARAESLAPADWRELHARARRRRRDAPARRARPGQGQPLPVRRRRRAPTACIRSCRVVQPVTLADELTLAPARGRRRRGGLPRRRGPEPRRRARSPPSAPRRAGTRRRSG